MYKKTAIRHHFTQYLKNTVLSVENRVYSGSVKPLQKENITYPYLTVFSRREEIIEEFTSHTVRELELKVGMFVKDNGSDDFDEVIENLMFEVESQMSKIFGINQDLNFELYREIQLASTEMQSDISSSSTLGGAEITYKIIYDYERPVNLAPLNDFDVQGSIENLIITNIGVPDND